MTLTRTTSDPTDALVAYLLPKVQAHAVVEPGVDDAYLGDLIRAEITRAERRGVVLLAGSWLWTLDVPSYAGGVMPPSVVLPFVSAVVGGAVQDETTLAPGPDFSADGGRLYFAPRLAGQGVAVALTAGLASAPETLPGDLVHGLVRRVATQYVQREDVAAGGLAAAPGAVLAADYLAPYALVSA